MMKNWLAGSLCVVALFGCASGDFVGSDRDERVEDQTPWRDDGVFRDYRETQVEAPAARPPLVNDPPDDGAPATYPEAGFHLLTIALDLDPQRPVMFLVRVKRDGIEVLADMQALSALDRATGVGPVTGLAPFDALESDEDLLVLPSWAIGEDGSAVTVVPKANPFDAVALKIIDLVLRPTGVTPLLCGDVEGELVSPWLHDLSGSTFTLIELTDPSQLSEPPVINCAGDQALPL